MMRSFTEVSHPRPPKTGMAVVDTGSSQNCGVCFGYGLHHGTKCLGVPKRDPDSGNYPHSDACPCGSQNSLPQDPHHSTKSGMHAGQCGRSLSY